MGAGEKARAVLRSVPLTAEEDEFDPFAGAPTDEPPADEGDDRVHGAKDDDGGR